MKEISKMAIKCSTSECGAHSVTITEEFIVVSVHLLAAADFAPGESG